jgi:N-acetylmuramoyl-L-alanine amidase
MSYKDLIVTLDPGHGGKDIWNRGANGYIEAHAMLKLALILQKILQKMGYTQVFLTRDGDYDVGVRERGEIAAGWGTFLFLSLHSNATGVPGANRSGVEVYESVDLQDELLAGVMSDAIADAMGIPSLGNKSWESTMYPGEDYLGVIDAAQDGGVEHILLIESGYHDNPSDEIKLLTPGMMEKIAEAMANVIDYFMSGKLSELEGKRVMADRELLIGCIGEDVRLFQKDLIRLGYDLGPWGLDNDGADGSFGTLTDTAVRHFQKSTGLLEDGKVGPKTKTKIADMVARLGNLFVAPVTTAFTSPIAAPVATTDDFKTLYESEKARANKYESELYSCQKKYDSLVLNITKLQQDYQGGIYK